MRVFMVRRIERVSEMGERRETETANFTISSLFPEKKERQKRLEAETERTRPALVKMQAIVSVWRSDRVKRGAQEQSTSKAAPGNGAKHSATKVKGGCLWLRYCR
jgi:hypothetical protein